jgi:predicted CXXCH cytochrome family protein
MECHLETSHHEPNEQRLYNRAIFSYRPGEPIGDFKLYFEPAESASNDSFEIAQAAYRLRKSACFRNSQMTCLTCHDPHDIPRGQEAVAHYTEVCLNCHRQVTHTVALPTGSTCLSCHMPKRRTDDAVHVVMTDHFIRRTRPRRDLLAPIAETILREGSFTKVALYYPGKAPPTPAAEIAMAEAQVNENGIARLETLLKRYQPDAPEPYLALAKAYERESDYAEVALWAQEALARRKDFRPAIVELVPALFATHQDQQATRVLEQAVEHYPTDDLLLSDLGNAYLRQGATAQAAAMLERALKANPDRSETHNLLGALALRHGDISGAEREFRESLRCQPDLAEANYNLGNLLMEKQSHQEASFYFEKAISVDAEYAAAHHNLGRVLVMMDQLPQAVDELREAARLDPGEFQIHQDLAGVLAATGHPAEAVTEYEHALALIPNQPQAQLGLGMALLSEHRGVEARPHLEAAARSADAEVAHAAAQILDHMAR